MKKGLLIIMTVAVLGAVELYAKNSPTGMARQSSPSSGSASVAPSSSATDPVSSRNYKDGTYTGLAADTPYGTVQIAVVINSGKIVDVNFLQMPSDRAHSMEVTTYAEPLLKQTTLDKQSANIDFVSGATSTTYGYQESLQAALDQAKTS